MKQEKFWLWVSAALPDALIYWAGIRLLSNGTSGKWSKQEVPALTVLAALDRWDEMMEAGDQVDDEDIPEMLRPGDPRCDYRGP